MAGRGTDIMLGGNSEYLAKQEMRKLKYSEELIDQATAFNETDNEEILGARKKFKELEEKYNDQIKDEKQKVLEAGGLKIIGTERHESRRIDNQLRGRSGRQGDPGESRFYIGLDDDLMKIFGGDKITTVYNMLGADENMPIESKMISKSVESAQKRVEDRNFSIRKNVLNYDDVMNTQREIIYKQRREVLDGENLKEQIQKMMISVAEELTNTYLSEETVNKEAFMQDIVDQKWMDHIDAMDELKNGIGLRAYGQKDPVVQYRIEGFDMFDEMIANIKIDVVKFLLNARKREDGSHASRQESAQITNVSLEDTAIRSLDGTTPKKESTPIVNNGPKVGRNDPCTCGSGKKYKNCCGK